MNKIFFSLLLLSFYFISCNKEVTIISLTTVSTNNVTSISETSATVGGNVTSDGGTAVTERGVYYNTSESPETTGTKQQIGSGLGPFSVELTGLSSNTQYFVKAYAINSKGTSYGNQVSFTTIQQILIPTVITDTSVLVTDTSATVGGNVMSDGGAAVTEHGVYYGTSENPETTGTKLLIGSGTGSFSTIVTGLTSNTKYFLKAYATNSQGTSYGSQINFKTNIEILIPTVTTDSITVVTDTSAIVGGNVTSDGGAAVTERGVYYGTSENPETTGTKLPIGSGIGMFSTNLTRLNFNIIYFIKAYAINSKGEALGEQESFTPRLTFTDNRDGNKYSYVNIGQQVWMAENLAYLPSISPSSTGSNAEPYYYVYGYEGADIGAAKATDNYKIYGVLYNWKAAMNGQSSSNTVPSDVQGVCPSGWHMPSDAEWDVLANYLGGSDIAGGKMKSTGTIEGGDGLWYFENTGATNESGFTGLPGGYRYNIGHFTSLGYYGTWWSSTEDETNYAWSRGLHYDYFPLYRGIGAYRDEGFSVRCLRD